ncbi:MAG TPA: phosphatidylglycerol lysyltransferase [Rectinemataceae bacterium]|nr:phosphatidylglycerol lysyltransferase [Rectinemataceae bacterium]
MALITHPATGFPVGDPDRLPLVRNELPDSKHLRAAASSLILSASGWRKVFAADGDEESLTEKVAPADLVLAGAAAIAFAGLLRGSGSIGKGPSEAPALLVGLDTRPTGPALADAMIRVFLALGFEPRYLFMVAAPEIMAYARRAAALPPGHDEHALGFCYVSASHNPAGHNGLKFGAAEATGGAERSGGVLSAARIAPMTEAFRALVADPDISERVMALMEAADRRRLSRIYAECSAWKRRSISAYTLFSHEVITGLPRPEDRDLFFEEMARSAETRPLGIVADFNGSARCLSIDRDLFAALGVTAASINENPRRFAHRIVPEGESLDQCRAELERAHAADPSFRAGYVPDCDGDRGNLVWFDETAGEARQLEAQEVFALCCVAELAQLVRNGELSYDEAGNAREKAAVVVNDATSMRINAIARAFDVDVYRAETGEANVVGLAASLRRRGYLVRILGEGSNGGNITHPSSVRDPLATMGALLKLLLLRDGSEGLYRIWMRLSRRLGEYRPDFELGDIVRSLPRFATTSVFEKRAALALRETDHAALKSRYRRIFLREWELRQPELKRRFGFISWEAFASRGEGESVASEDFGSAGKGGLRIVLQDEAGRPRAFLWMRGSGTESVFRIMADIEGGGPEDEEYLLSWQSSMLRAADLAEAEARR